MAYTAYDWQQTLAEKADYAEGRLRHGAPVVAFSYDEGVLLLTFKRHQAKLYEVYDRLALGALGNPSDLEAVRQLAVDFAHAEGYQRSAEDVSVQRVVGFAISPVLKRAFSDPLRMPLVLRAVFAQVGPTPEEDALFVLGYDGEFSRERRWAPIAGTAAAEARMRRALERAKIKDRPTALRAALRAWAAGQWQPPEEHESADQAVPLPSVKEGQRVLAQALEAGQRVEAVLLVRESPKERRYHPLPAEALAPLLPKGPA